MDNKTSLDPEDDVAHVKWGGNWRMPVKAEVRELIDKCTWTLTKQGGVRGYKVTSKTNGNSIFLPEAGYRVDGSLYDAGKNGNYWTATLEDDRSNNDSFLLYISPNHLHISAIYRSSGLSVRPVYSDLIMWR